MHRDKNFETAFKLFKNSTIESIKELALGCEDDEEAMDSFKDAEQMIAKARNFDEVEGVLFNELGYEEEMIINEYRWTLAQLVEMKKNDLFVEVI